MSSDFSNWKIAYKKENEEVTIIRALSCDRTAVVPEQIDGLPVAAVSSRAFSPFAPDIPENALWINLGVMPEDTEDLDNHQIEKLVLPCTLKNVGNAAFIYMASLDTIVFDDCLTVWNGNALSSCKALKRIIIRAGETLGPALSHIAEDMDSCLDISIERNGTIDTRLIFPSYEEMTLEDGCVAQGSMFSYHINGAGYPHHHCFKSRTLNLRDYDNLWKEYTGMGYMEEEAVRLAWYRLRYPKDLSDSAQLAYKGFIIDHSERTLDLILHDRDSLGLSLFIDLCSPDQSDISYALDIARKKHLSELMPLLLEQTRNRKASVIEDYEL